MVDIGDYPFNPDEEDISSEPFCTSLSKLSEMAWTFISENGKSKGEDSNDIKYLLQECIDTLANYRDECKKLKKINLLNNESELDNVSNSVKSKIFKIYESAYIYYKIIHITILVRIPDLPKFKQIKSDKNIINGGQRKDLELMEIYNTLVNTLLNDENIAHIKNFIKHNSNSNSNSNNLDTKSKSQVNTTEKTTSIEDMFELLPKTGSLVSVEVLGKIMAQRNSEVLLIDVRPRLEFNKYQIKSKNIICIEPISFKESYSDHELEKKSMITSPNEEIELFHNRQKFKYIILYTDDNERNNFGTQKQSVLLSILLNKSFEKPLENSKVFVLNKGISSWIKFGGQTLSLSKINEKKNIDDTDDSIYINGNTSRLSLQTFPKMIPRADSPMDISMQNMMSSSPTVMNGNYIVHEQQYPKQTSPNSDVKRTSSLKKMFSNFRSSSSNPSSTKLSSVSSPISQPHLTIQSTPNPHLYSSTTSVVSVSGTTASLSDRRSVQYPDAPNLQATHINGAISYDAAERSSILQNSLNRNIAPLSLSRSPSRTPSFEAYQHTRSHSFNEDRQQRRMPMSKLSQLNKSETNSDIYDSSTIRGGSDHIINAKPLPEIPQLPARPMSTSFSSTPNSRSLALANDDTKEVFDDKTHYFKGVDLDFIIGLENMGNSCYMNCIIQCILGTHELTKIFLNNSYEKHINLNSKLGSKGVLAKNFSRLVNTMYTQSDSGTPNSHSSSGHSSKKLKKIPVRPSQFKFACGSINSLFKGVQQQDCQEFSQFLLDGLHEDLNQCGGNPPLKGLSKQAEELREKLSFRIASSIEWERYLTTDFSVIVDLFQGQYASRLQCKVCMHTSTTYQPFSVLSVPIPSDVKNCSLVDCFNDFTKCENLEIDEQWSCPKCKKKQPSTKKLTITRLPRNLIIHLKRFDNRLNKNNSFINYPYNLDLTEFWPDDYDGKLPPGVKDELPTRGQVPPFNYKLYGVACHFGSLYGGHYTAYVDKGAKNGWYYFDDTVYRPIKNHHEAITSSAYVLFYHRVY